jgi:hypothetical protein
MAQAPVARHLGKGDLRHHLGLDPGHAAFPRGIVER